jgi:hypothetical protein
MYTEYWKIRSPGRGGHRQMADENMKKEKKQGENVKRKG